MPETRREAQRVVIDCKGHLMGRLAFIVAKELLNGQNVVLVRTEDLNISGSLFRNKLKFHLFLRKRTNTNPKKGPIHFKAPSRIMWRVVRGMIPHKTARGANALARLKAFEGCPRPYDRVKKMVVPQALTNLRLKPSRNFCRLGDLAAKVGWKHDDLLKRLEGTRKTKAAAFYTTKKELAKRRAQAVQECEKELQETNEALAALGY